MVPAFSPLGRDRLLLPLGLRGGKTGGADEEELEVELKVAVVFKEEVDGMLVVVGGSRDVTQRYQGNVILIVRVAMSSLEC